MDDHMER
jgi:hypothetical protein